jgi:hypothetical protein
MESMNRRWVPVLWVALCLAGLPARAQMKMSVKQLQAFVQSSIELKHQDKQVAKYLEKFELTERLTASVVEDLQAAGAGPKTVEALENMVTASAKLPLPPPEHPKEEPTGPPPPSPEDQKRVLDGAREFARNYMKQLPDFLCLQVTRRYYDPTGLEFWRLADTVATRLSYVEQHEDYKVIMVDNKPSDIAYDQLGGATSTGEFGSLLKELFDPDTQTDFAWERWGKLRGRLAHVYKYRVLLSRSRWRINYEKRQEIVVGYSGLVYIDAELPMVVRITMDAENIPASFPIQQASTILDYDFTKIGDAEFMLPLKAEVHMREGKLMIKNEVEFRNYRKFGAETTITFGVPDPLSKDQTEEQPVTKQP